MEWKRQIYTSLVVLGGTFSLSGCVTPGFQYLEPPGFSSTYFHLYGQSGMVLPAADWQGRGSVAPALYYPEVRNDQTAQLDGVVPNRSVVQPPPAPAARSGTSR